ncbi:MAG: acetate/propionate family kinase [Oscillospiraceae bacterium]|nr:acetate/propionate family kinase [Oscillospiraceae bacterium]
MKILICNVGSTSLKYQLIDMNNEETLARGGQERVGAEMGSFAHKDVTGKEFKKELPIADHGVGITLMMEALADIADPKELACVGFKVVLAKGVTGVQLMTEDVLKAMEEYNCIAPSHNPPYIAAVRQFAKLMPGLPLIGSFETGFHATMPPRAYLYSIPKELTEKYGIRRYGFHGASHEYVSGKVMDYMGRDDIRIITCHLGGSGSICAIQNGKSIDTNFGFSLQCGTIHNNRCGDIDPFIPIYLQEVGYSLEEVKTILNKQSGLLGMSGGISNDMRDLEKAAAEGNVDAQNAIDAYCYAIKKQIGAYAAIMGGVDAIAFSGGIGENSPMVREKCLEGLNFIGVSLNKSRNQQCRPDSEISDGGGWVKLFVVGTNEELIVARKTKKYLEEHKM